MTSGTPEPTSILFADRYRLIGPALGKGGTGQVFRAWHVDAQRWVALKLLDTPASLAAERRLHGFGHPHVCPILDFGVWQGKSFIVMELAAGSLEQQFRGAPPERDLDERLSELVQLADGLAALHQIGILHRDLKPANVLRMSDGRLVLCDFGLATPSGREDATRFVGTPGHIAPECALGAAASYASDVWALGLVLYQLFFFIPPRWSLGPNGPRIISSVPSERKSQIQRQVEDLCLECLAFDPNDRYRDAQAVRRRLARIADGSGLVLESGGRAGLRLFRHTPSWWENVVVFALTGVAFSLLLVVIGWFRH